MKSSVNYQTILEDELFHLKESGIKPKLLLHACCAPCSSYVIEYLQEYFFITVYFFNPNIFPEAEHTRRLEELKRFLKDFRSEQQIGLIHEKYSPMEFAECAKGFEEEKEGGERCFRCFDLRLAKTAEKAGELKYDYFTTTLTISPHKNAEVINQKGTELSKKHAIKYLVSDFKKKNGFKRSLELSLEYGLYRQDYCGCEFSMKELIQE